jgi:hypothetical protein
MFFTLYISFLYMKTTIITTQIRSDSDDFDIRREFCGFQVDILLFYIVDSFSNI